MIALIAAMSKNGVIGNKGGLPWHLPAELAYFKKMTLGKTVLMGRRTLSSLKKPLPFRRNCVLTRQVGFIREGFEIFPNLESVFNSVSIDEELMVIGGASLYEITLPIAQRLYLTFIDCEITGDTYFPQWDPTEWQEINRVDHPANNNNCFAFTSVQYDRIMA